ncbi:surface [Cordyceps militaris]|uniref:Surface n=1 Tax=Cordyceps militaris TaxID=73501 RepID=A0A2H4SJU4_CORMI|nr:surface [Cordyceps militaris]
MVRITTTAILAFAAISSARYLGVSGRGSLTARTTGAAGLPGTDAPVDTTTPVPGDTATEVPTEVPAEVPPASVPAEMPPAEVPVETPPAEVPAELPPAEIPADPPVSSTGDIKPLTKLIDALATLSEMLQGLMPGAGGTVKSAVGVSFLG